MENNSHPAGGATVVTGDLGGNVGFFFGRNSGATQSAPVTVIDVCTSSGRLGSARQELYSFAGTIKLLENVMF